LQAEISYIELGFDERTLLVYVHANAGLLQPRS